MIRLIKKIIRRLRKEVVYLSQLIQFILIYCISIFIPKTNRIVVVGGWFGERFADNSRHFFLHLNHNKKSLNIRKVIWITKNDELYDELSKSGYEVYKKNSLKSLWYHLRSNIHVIDQSKDDINYKFSIRTKRINLWHGFPLKKIGAYTKKPKLHARKKASPSIRQYVEKGTWIKSYYLATSEFSKDVFKHAFQKNDNDLIISGYPRLFDSIANDNRSFKTKSEENSLNIIRGFKEKGYKIVGYFPTFRDNAKTHLFGIEDSVCLKAFLNKLEDIKIKIVTKMHFADDFDEKLLSKKANLINLQKQDDVYSFFYDIDLMLTDYSSVYFDFLFIEKPIVFFPYDLEYYISEDRGLIFDYESYTPGPKIHNANDFLDYMTTDFEQLASDYFIKYNQMREEIKEQIFGDYENNDIKHLYNEIRRI